MSIGQKITATSLETYELILTALKNQKIACFSHPRPSNARFKSVCKRLADFEEGELADCIEDECGYRPLSVTKFDTKSGENIYLVEWDKNDMNPEKLKQIDRIDIFKPTWEKYKPRSRGPTQCKNCYILGHGLKHCHRPKICTYCSSTEHLTSECLRAIRNEEGQTLGSPICNNCAHFGRRDDHVPMH